MLSLWLHRPSKYLGTRGTRRRLLFAECPAQSPRIDSRVFALNLKNRLEKRLCGRVVVPVQAFLPRARGLIFDGECFGGETQCRSRRSRKSVPARLPPAPVTKRHVEPVLLQPNVLRVVCGFVFLSKAFVCVSETVRDQSSKYSRGKEKYTFLKLKQT